MPALTLKALATLVLPSLVSAHGGLTIPPPRNNYRNHNPFNLTKDAGQGAALLVGRVRDLGLRRSDVGHRRVVTSRKSHQAAKTGLVGSGAPLLSSS